MTGPLAALTPPGMTAYVLVFGAAAVICFGAIGRARRIEDDDTRRGLVGLLVTSGGWAATHVGFIAAPSPALSLAFYYTGLVIGFSTLGPWLYFCSAFTGRAIHRSRAIRRVAVGVFLAVVAVKLTNPIHGLYFRSAFVTTPFPHLAIENLTLHWIAMGLSYALVTVGYFMLLELFLQVDHDTNALLGLVAVTGIPLLLDVVGLSSTVLLDITYEPLGVAAFAVGVLFVFIEDFQTIQLTGHRAGPTIVFDDDDRVRQANAAAHDLFPDLEVGEPMETAVPEVAAIVEADEDVVEIHRDGGPRYYQLSTNDFARDAARLGRLVMLTDITDREQYRTEIERQNERLEQFASTVSHDLRNPLNVAQGQVELAREETDSEPLTVVSNSLERMDELIGELLKLARQGRPISETEPVGLSTVADDAWSVVDSGDATLTVAVDGTVEADVDRLQQLFENLFRNAIDHGRPDVSIEVGTLDERGFYVADDGPGIPEDDRDVVFESGFSTAADGTGFGLAIVAEIVEAHGWSIAVTEGDEGGARFEVTDVVLQPGPPDDSPFGG